MNRKIKRSAPPKVKAFTELVKACYKAGFKPLPAAMKEASRRWKEKKQA